MKACLNVLIEGKVSVLGRNNNKRMMRNFAIKSLEVLARERDSLGENFEQVLIHIYDSSLSFNQNEDDLNGVK